MNKWLGLLAVVLVFATSWMLGRHLQNSSEASAQPMLVELCQPVGQDCVVQFADSRLVITMQRPVEVMTPFIVELKSTADISEINLQFRMQDMDMGEQRFRMNKNEQGVWLSQVTLPVCVLGRSDWLVVMDVNYQNQMWRGELAFSLENISR